MGRGATRGVTVAAILAAVAALLSPTRGAAAVPEPAGAANDLAGAARVYHEVRTPEGPARGVVILLHGSGWQAVGSSGVRHLSSYRDLVARLRAAGFVTVNATYRQGEAGWTDVLALHRQVRQRWPALPLAAWGQSSGGHWAMLLGLARPLSGVVAEAAPADFTGWRDSYPCFYPDCRPVRDAFTGLGAYWFANRLSPFFGAPTSAFPNVLDYSVTGQFERPSAPAFLIYGARQRPDGSPLADGEPMDGVGGAGPHAYVSGLEVDELVPQQQGHALAAALGADLRLLGRGTTPWVHAYVNETQLEDAHAAAVSHLARQAPPVTPHAARVAGVSKPEGPLRIVGCSAAPPGSALLSTGGWSQTVTTGLDASENACAPAPDRVGADVAPGRGPRIGMSLHPIGPFGEVPSGATARVQFAAPPGTSISSYRAAFAARVADGGWRLRLLADDRPLLSCEGACRALDSGPAASGWPPTVLEAPPGTRGLTWEMTCTEPDGCAASNPTAEDQLAAWLNVFSSEVFLDDTSPPEITLSGDAFDESPNIAGSALSGRVAVNDAVGISRMRVLLDDRTAYTAELPCDYARPRPCADLEQTVTLPANVAAGDHVVTIEAVDAGGAVTRTSRSLPISATSAPSQNEVKPQPQAPPSNPNVAGASPSIALVVSPPAPDRRVQDRFLTATAPQLLRACVEEDVVIRAVTRRGRTIVVTGVAGPAPGRRTARVFTNTGAEARGSVTTSGTFRVTVQLSGRPTPDVSVRAQVGASRSRASPLIPTLSLTAQRREAGVLIRVSTRRAGTVRLHHVATCGRSTVLARGDLRPGEDLRVHVRKQARAVLLFASVRPRRGKTVLSEPFAVTLPKQ